MQKRRKIAILLAVVLLCCASLPCALLDASVSFRRIAGEQRLTPIAAGARAVPPPSDTREGLWALRLILLVWASLFLPALMTECTLYPSLPDAAHPSPALLAFIGHPQQAPPFLLGLSSHRMI